VATAAATAVVQAAMALVVGNPAATGEALVAHPGMEGNPAVRLARREELAEMVVARAGQPAARAGARQVRVALPGREAKAAPLAPAIRVAAAVLALARRKRAAHPEG